MKDQLLTILSNDLGITFNISDLDIKGKSKINVINNNTTLDKDTFFSIVSLLEEIEEASEAVHESGIDLYLYESKFFSIIEILLNEILNDKQLSLLHQYIYGEQLPNLPVLNEKGETLDVETPEDLWEAINKYT